MRISDWSSDVCSSDLRIGDNAAKSLLPIIVLKVRHGQAGDFIGEQFDHFILVTDMMIQKAGGYAQLPRHAAHIECLDSFRPRQRDQCRCQALPVERRPFIQAPPTAPGLPSRRSEEHTSELQSLMRISSAVFCLKKKKT